MSEPFLAEIKLFAGNFAIRGWAFCDGQLLPIAQNTALFSLIGTIYGGDGRTTTALPDLRGRVPVHPGSGPGLTPRKLGQRGGAEQVSLTLSTLPTHHHTISGTPDVKVANQVGAISSAKGNPLGKDAIETAGSNDVEMYVDKDTASFSNGFELGGVTTGDMAITNTGGGAPHHNMQPWLGVNYLIALVGVFPSRS